MDQGMLDYYYQRGDIPDRYYNQLNGKTASENYRRLKLKSSRKKKEESFLEEFVMNMLRASLDVALKEIMQEIIPPK